MARNHNLADTGTNDKMWRMWLTLRQTKLVDSEAILKADFSLLKNPFIVPSLNITDPLNGIMLQNPGTTG